jgi:hypothetical protein
LATGSALTFIGSTLTNNAGIFKANGAPSLVAATAGEAILAPEGTYGALLYGRGSTYDVVLGSRGTNVALAVLANSTNLYAAGNVGIGTGSPNYKLQVNNATSGDSSYIQITHADAGTGASDGLVIGLGTGSSPIAYIDQKENAAMVFSTNGTERARFNPTGALVFAGGTTTADGIGITFPATQSASSNANTLDDYEEGTWTPTVVLGGVGITVNTASYTKIGRMVYLQFDVTIASNSSASAFQIGSLPFAIGSSRFTGVAIGYNTSGTNMAAIIGAADIEFFLAGSGTAATNIQASGARFIGATCYQV